SQPTGQQPPGDRDDRDHDEDDRPGRNAAVAAWFDGKFGHVPPRLTLVQSTMAARAPGRRSAADCRRCCVAVTATADGRRASWRRFLEPIHPGGIWGVVSEGSAG